MNTNDLRARAVYLDDEFSDPETAHMLRDAVEHIDQQDRESHALRGRVHALEAALTCARNMLSAVMGDIEDGYGLADMRGKYVIALMNARDDVTDALRGACAGPTP